MSGHRLLYQPQLGFHLIFDTSFCQGRSSPSFVSCYILLGKINHFQFGKKSDFDVSETLIITDKQKSNLKREKCGGKC